MQDVLGNNQRLPNSHHAVSGQNRLLPQLVFVAKMTLKSILAIEFLKTNYAAVFEHRLLVFEFVSLTSIGAFECLSTNSTQQIIEDTPVVLCTRPCSEV